MAWIESHQGLRGHPKTKKLVRRLKSSAAIIVGHLHFIWWWALDFAQDGEITQFDPEDIADACDWSGDPEEFFNALVDAGFIDKVEHRYFLHDWYDYAGKLIELRKKDAERKRNSRGKEKKSEGSPEDVQRTSEGVQAESMRDLNPNLDLITTTTPEDDFAKVSKAYGRLHGKYDIETKHYPLLTDLLKTMTADFLIEVMEQKHKEKVEAGESVNGFGYYEPVFRERHKQRFTVVSGGGKKETDWDEIKRQLEEAEREHRSGA